MFRRIRQTAGREPNARPASVPAHQYRNRTDDPYQIVSYPDQLAKWLRQVNADTSGVQLGQLVKRQDYGEVLWSAREYGESVRRKAAARLYQIYEFPITPDPREQIPFGPVAIFKQALAAVHIDSTHLLIASDGNGLKRMQVDLSAMLRHNIYGWIQTYPDSRVPDVLVDPGSPFYRAILEPMRDSRDDARGVLDLPYWLIHASLCLWVLLQNWGVHTGYATPGRQVILPPLVAREPNAVPIAHMFLKALYGLGTYCPSDLGCPCNHALHLLRAVPPRHPEMTGAMPPWPYGQQQQQHAPRPGTVTSAPPPRAQRNTPPTQPPARQHQHQHTPSPYQIPPGHPAAPSRPLQPGERLPAFPTPATPPLGTSSSSTSSGGPVPRSQRDLIRDLGLDEIDADAMDIPNGWDDDDEQ